MQVRVSQLWVWDPTWTHLTNIVCHCVLQCFSQNQSRQPVGPSDPHQTNKKSFSWQNKRQVSSYLEIRVGGGVCGRRSECESTLCCCLGDCWCVTAQTQPRQNTVITAALVLWNYPKCSTLGLTWDPDASLVVGVMKSLGVWLEKVEKPWWQMWPAVFTGPRLWTRV